MCLDTCCASGDSTATPSSRTTLAVECIASRDLIGTTLARKERGAADLTESVADLGSFVSGGPRHSCSREITRIHGSQISNIPREGCGYKIDARNSRFEVCSEWSLDSVSEEE